MKYLFGLLLFMLCSSSYSQMFRNPNSLQEDDEEVVLSLTKKVEPKKTTEKAFIWGPIIGFGIEMAISTVQTMLANEAEKFTKEYKSRIATDDFLTAVRKASNYYGLRVQRYVQLEGKKGKSLASDLNFEFVFAKNGKSFQVRPLNPVVYYSKCKTKKKDDDIDLKVSLVMEAVWTNSDQEPQKEVILDESFEFASVKIVGDKNPIEKLLIDSAASVFPDAFTIIPERNLGNWKERLQSDTEAFKKPSGDRPTVKLHKESGWIPLFPPDAFINIRVVVVESDDYGKRQEAVAKFIEDNRDFFSGVIEAYTKKE